MKSVFIIGGSRQVVEFGARCRASGYAVACKPAGKGHVPAGCRRAAAPARTVTAAVELTHADPEVKRKNLALLERALPASTPVLSCSTAITAAEQSRWMRRPERLVGMCGLPTLMNGKLMELAAPPSSDAAHMKSAAEFFASIGMEISVVDDRAGMVMPRIVCQLINEAYFALTERIASPEDIDTAMKLGSGTPEGPVAWAGRIGFRTVVELLAAVARETGEERYRVAPLLRRLALEPA